MASSISVIKRRKNELRVPDILVTLHGTVAAAELTAGHTAILMLGRRKAS